MNRRCVALAIALFALTFPCGNALAQTYPSRPVRIIVPFAAGGAVDILARLARQQAQRAVRPAGGGGESRRRRRQSCARCARQGGARRLHHPSHHQRPGDQPVALPHAAVRRAQGLRAGHPGGRLAARDRRPSQASRELHRRIDRARQGQAGRPQLRLDRDRQSVAPDHGDAEDRRQHRNPRRCPTTAMRRSMPR